jgi:hypothetical protein
MALLVIQFVLLVPTMGQIASPPAGNVGKWNEVVSIAENTEGKVLFEMMPTAMMRSGKKDSFMSTVLLAYMKHKGKWDDGFVVDAVRSRRFSKIFVFDDWYFMAPGQNRVFSSGDARFERVSLKEVGAAIAENYVEEKGIGSIDEISGPLTIRVYAPRRDDAP